MCQNWVCSISQSKMCKYNMKENIELIWPKWGKKSTGNSSLIHFWEGLYEWKKVLSVHSEHFGLTTACLLENDSIFNVT